MATWNSTQYICTAAKHYLLWSVSRWVPVRFWKRRQKKSPDWYTVCWASRQLHTSWVFSWRIQAPCCPMLMCKAFEPLGERNQWILKLGSIGLGQGLQRRLAKWVQARGSDSGLEGNVAFTKDRSPGHQTPSLLTVWSWSERNLQASWDTSKQSHWLQNQRNPQDRGRWD